MIAQEACWKAGKDERGVSTTARQAEYGVQVALIRDIFGNPFRPVTFDPAWRTSTAVALPNPFEREAGSPGAGTRRLADNLLLRMRAARGNAACVRAGPFGG